MKTSASGLQFLTDNEGIVLHPYEDQVGKPTIGVGHLIKPGEVFPEQITEEQALNLLASDVARFEQAVNDQVEEGTLSQNQFDALVDFAFNLGEGALQQLLAHGVAQVPEQLPRWCRAGGEVLEGLVERRQREVELWNS